MVFAVEVDLPLRVFEVVFPDVVVAEVVAAVEHDVLRKRPSDLNCLWVWSVLVAVGEVKMEA